MVKAIIIAMPRLMLITSGIRQDFEGTLNLIQKTNTIFCDGLRANFSSNPNVEEISSEDLANEFCVRKYIRHYHEFSKTYDVTTFLYGQKESNVIAGMSLKRVLAYGNVIEFSFDNIDVNHFFEVLPEMNKKIERTLEHPIAKKVDEMYLGEGQVTKKDSYFVPPIFSVYNAILVVESAQEFKEIMEKFGTSFSFRDVLTNAIAVGSQLSSEFFGMEPFFSISINPLVVNVQEKENYRFYNIFGALCYFLASIGELHNILEVMSDSHELCTISEPSILQEIYEKIGRFKINPIKDAFNLYGLKNFQKYERKWRETLTESVNYMRGYKTKGSMIIWKKEGMPHFQQIIALQELIKSFRFYEPDNIILMNITAEDFVSKVQEKFDADLEGFMVTIKKFFDEIADVIEGSRTTVQLNLAIMAIFWTIVFTVLLSQPVFDSLRTAIQDLIKWLSSISSQKVNVAALIS